MQARRSAEKGISLGMESCQADFLARSNFGHSGAISITYIPSSTVDEAYPPTFGSFLQRNIGHRACRHNSGSLLHGRGKPSAIDCPSRSIRIAERTTLHDGFVGPGNPTYSPCTLSARFTAQHSSPLGVRTWTVFARISCEWIRHHPARPIILNHHGRMSGDLKRSGTRLGMRLDHVGAERALSLGRDEGFVYAVGSTGVMSVRDHSAQTRTGTPAHRSVEMAPEQ